MTEAVIVSAVRSPIGRAFKGSLKDMRGDDLAVHVPEGRADDKARRDGLENRDAELIRP